MMITGITETALARAEGKICQQGQCRRPTLEAALRALIDSLTHPEGHDWPELRTARAVLDDVF